MGHTKESIIGIFFKKWLSAARITGNFQAQVLFSLFYLIFLSVIGIIFRFTDPLELRSQKPKKKSQFDLWNHPSDDLESARKQF